MNTTLNINNHKFLKKVFLLLVFIFFLPNFLGADLKPIICIDPGHPSENNSGKTLVNGTNEVTINWQIALQLKQYLIAKGFAVVLTKQSLNQYITNKDRAAIANKYKANLFLRLHCDYGNGSGITFYYPSKQGKKYGVVGPSPQVISRSKIFAYKINSITGKILNGYLKNNGVKGDNQTFIGSKQGALTGSIFSQVPTVLVEMVFLNNKKDTNFIKSKSGQNLMVKALGEGVIFAVKN